MMEFLAFFLVYVVSGQVNVFTFVDVICHVQTFLVGFGVLV